MLYSVGMHCSGWYLIPQKGNKRVIGVSALADLMRQHKYYFKIIGFDCCYMATVEVLYELSPYCAIILACESASPYMGFNSQHMIYSFINDQNFASIAINIATDFIRRNQSLKGSETDVAVLSTMYTDELMILLNQVHLSLLDIKKSNKLVSEDDTYPTYDLISTIRTSAIESSIKLKLEKLWPKVVVFYEQNKLLKQRKESPQFNGLAFSPCPMVDNEEGPTYNDLSFKAKLVVC